MGITYSVRLSDCGKFILCRVSGGVDFESGAECAVQARLLGKQHGVHAFLVDMRGTPNVETTQNNLRFATQKMPDLEGEKDDKTAFLVTPGDTSHDQIVQAAQAAGYQFQRFQRWEKALAWLHE